MLILLFINVSIKLIWFLIFCLIYIQMSNIVNVQIRHDMQNVLLVNLLDGH